MRSWREVAIDFTEVGKSLAIIGEAIGSINSTGVVTDEVAKVWVRKARNAAKRMVKHLESIEFEIDEESK